MKPNHPAPTPANDDLARAVGVFFGMVLAIAVLKFINPPVLVKAEDWPENGWEWVISAWPMAAGYWLLAAMVFLGLFAARKEAKAKWLIVLPLVWLGWQFVSATHTVNGELTRATIKHFAACVVCFYLGFFVLARMRNPMPFLMPMGVAFGIVLAVGIQQRFGGLEMSREYFRLYVYPQMTTVPEDYLKRIMSDRIFSTQFYPNALAGIILLLLPATLAMIWISDRRLTPGARGFLMAAIGLAALGCLYWSGSKGGWLLMLLLGLAALLRLQFSKKLKLALIAVVLIAGLAGFAIRYAGFFQRGATSVGARFDYWEAAIRTTLANPIFGTGPGTFGIAYKAIKRPESEMARLAHNDYLQQACDSGLPGFFAFAAFILGALVYGYPKPTGAEKEGLLRFSVWLGVMAWALQSLFEFGLYIPSMSWCGFAWLGWLAGLPKPIDKAGPDDYPANR